MQTRWALSPVDEGVMARLSEGLEVPPVVAEILARRGVRDTTAGRAFLQPQLADLHDPLLLPGMEAAVARLSRAARDREKVLIHGDYDADGITATALLLHFFRLLHLDAEWYIPHRVEEGYGLKMESMQRFVKERLQLLITVDCGINSMAEVAAAQSQGLDVIITDHHEPQEEVPNAVAVVDPKLTGSKYPCRELSGVGVAFKLAWAASQHFSAQKKLSKEFQHFLMDSLGLVALGTITDVAPLLGENRVLVTYGLEALAASGNPGVKGLIAVSGLEGKSLAASDVAFRIGPRLNATGRIADARLGVELLMESDAIRAYELAQELDRTNRERRQVQDEILTHARQRAEDELDLEACSAIVLADEAWHAGVVGIAASKLAEEFYRPTILIAMDGEAGKGSARSIAPVDLFEALRTCERFLLSYGGHAQAAGLRIERGQLDAFTEEFSQVVARQMGRQPLAPALEIDAEVRLTLLTTETVNWLQRLAPFGAANPRPKLASVDLQVVGEPRRMGQQGRHLSFYVRQGTTSFRAVAFGMGGRLEEIRECAQGCSLVYSPQINNWRGSNELELIVWDIAPGRPDFA